MSLWLQQFLQAIAAEEIENNSLVSLNSGFFIREERRTQKAIVAIEAIVSDNLMLDPSDCESIQADFRERSPILEYDAHSPRDEAEKLAFNMAINNYKRSINDLTEQQKDALNVYMGLNHPAIKWVEDVLGGRVTEVRDEKKLLWCFDQARGADS